MIKVLSAAEMREVDRLTTDECGIPSIILMENAARAVADSIERRLGRQIASALIVCGKGNNGGDGAALARILDHRGAAVSVYAVGPLADRRGDAHVNFDAIARINSPSFRLREVSDTDPDWCDELDEILIGFDVVVDALFGTGLTRPLTGVNAQIVEVLKFAQASVSGPLYVAIDMPSGLDADSGNAIGPHSVADLTVTFTAPKMANVLPPASDANGELNVADIGSPPALFNSPFGTFVTDRSDVKSWMNGTAFRPGSYKQKRGSVLLAVGSRDYSGAAALAGNAAMRSGAGLVTIATPISAQTAIAGKTLEEVITRGLPENTGGLMNADAFGEIRRLAEKADVIGIGCGIGIGENRERIRSLIVDRTRPMVIDADGLNALAPFDLDCGDGPPVVLTPHEGEFLRLLGTEDRTALSDRVGAVRDFAAKHNAIIVLKGQRVLIGGGSGGRIHINPTGNPALGKAGGGDTLTGIIAGFIAQTVVAESAVDDPRPMREAIFEAVVAAVYVAGRAGDIALDRYGDRVMLPSDVRDSLAAAFAELYGND